MFQRFGVGILALTLAGILAGCQGLVNGVPNELTVTLAGGGTGAVTSAPSGINCPGTCSAAVQGQITLTAAPAQGFTFAGWTGACTGSTTTCTLSVTAASASAVTATFGASLQSINHIIFLAQENRSFDSYFGALRQYWSQNNVPDQAFNGLPQFDPAGDPNAGPAPVNPGCDPAFPFIAPNTNSYCQIDPSSPNVQSFHAASTCVENPSPSWAEAHRSWNVHDPTSATPLLNGFVDAGADDARQHTNLQGLLSPFFDTNGVRVMGYYDGTDLNYYYSMASTFSTSDTWFAPVMSRTPPNREFLIAGTSHGYVYQRGTNPPLDTPAIPSTTIYQELSNAGISWKIYVDGSGGSAPCADTDTACLLARSYIHDFTFAQTIRANISDYTNNPMHSIAPISQFYTDAIGGTLPQVAQIEPASDAGLDEHPEDNDPLPGQPACCSMQAGANFASMAINAVMCGQDSPPSGTCTPGPSWADSVFVFTFDEPGGFYDHVPPQPTVNPDGILPVDLFSNDPCFGAETPGTICDFAYTGYRIPLIVISPFAKANFVSHQVRDTTSIIKLIETRFNLPALTKRDAAQVGMDDPTTGFFDFVNAPFKTPPSNIPAQTVLGQASCFVDPPPTSP